MTAAIPTTYGIAREVTRRGGVFNIIDFGASTSDTDGDSNKAAIQAAIDAAAEAGGTVMVPPGTWTVNGTIYIKSGVTLSGVGAASEFVAADDASFDQVEATVTSFNSFRPVLCTDDDAENVVIRDLAVDANGDNQSTEPGPSYAGVAICRASHVTVERVTSVNCGYGILPLSGYRAMNLLIFSASHIRVIGGRYEKAGYENIGIRQESRDVTVAYAYCKDARRHNIAPQPDSARIALIGCEGWNRAEDASTLDSAFVGFGITLHNASDVDVIGCQMHSRLAALRPFDASANIRVIGGLFRTYGDESIVSYGAVHEPGGFDAATDVLIDGATIINDSENPGGGGVSSGININNGSRWRILGCDISSGTGPSGCNAIYIDSDSDHEDMVISDCRLNVRGSEDAILAYRAKRLRVTGNTFSYPEGNRAAISWRDDCEGLVFTGNAVTQGQRAIRILTNATGQAVVSDNDFRACSEFLSFQTTDPPGFRVRDNLGFDTTSSVAATIESGNTSIAVDHDLTAWRTLTAADFQVTPTSGLGNASTYWVSSVSSTQVTISVDADPGENITFAIRGDATRN